jgi:hypothetical protein
MLFAAKLAVSLIEVDRRAQNRADEAIDKELQPIRTTLGYNEYYV